MREIIDYLDFPEPIIVSDRSSIADLFKPGQRCGIYLLQFENGEYYCGQAIDVTRRYVQHTKTHPDINAISFKQVESHRLNDVERHSIGVLEQNGFRLRNISLTSVIQGPADLDTIMDEGSQQRWLDDLTWIDLDGERVQDEGQRRKYARRFDRFSILPESSEVLEFLNRYVPTCIPVAKRSEISFWSCTCLPRSSDPDIRVNIRINIFWQEVVNCVADKATGKLYYSFQLAKSPLKNVRFLKRWQRAIKYDAYENAGHVYSPGGQDQTRIEVSGTRNAIRLLDDPHILGAIRLFNLRLMRKGANNFNRYHCLQMVDHIFE